MIPTNIIIDIPFPIPLLVICSPSHIKSAVPAINDITTIAPVNIPEFIKIPEFLYERYIPNPSTRANTNVSNFVYLFILALPSSPPSFTIFSKDGITIANN